MALSGIYGYGLSPYISNSLNSNEDIAVNQQEDAAVAGVNALKEHAAQAEASAAQQEAQANEKVGNNVKAPKVSNPNDFTFDFRKNNPYNLVGATSPVEDIDVEKAVSDMKKEVVLDQYKFFVGDANLGTDADGTVRLKNIDQL